MVGLVPVLQEDRLLSQPPEREIQLDALIPGHRVVIIPVEEKQGRVDPVGEEDRGVVDVLVPGLPEVTAQAALPLLVLELDRKSVV